jgi:hypothetical protein
MRCAPIVFIVLLYDLSAYARDAKQVRVFRAANPSPATGKTSGARPGWVVDHVVPLCANGVDHPSNMQWQTREDSLIKHRAERKACAAKRRN